MTEFKVPELGENVEAADVSRVLVNVGDTIKKDQPVLELETDKATIEVPSSVAGVIKEIKVQKGQKIQVGAVVLTVEEAGNGAGKPAAAPAAHGGGTRVGRDGASGRGDSGRCGTATGGSRKARTGRPQGHLDAAASFAKLGTP